MPRNLRSESPSQGTKRKRGLRPVQTSLRGDSADQPPLNTTSPWPTGPSQNDSSSSAPQSPASRGHFGPELGDGLEEVERIHRALNIVFTFCCTRKHVVTTFNNIKAAVESHLGKPLTVEDVAAVVAIRPEAINFVYVDELTLQNDAKGSERDTTFKMTTPKDITSQGPPPDASVGGLTGKDSLESSFSFDSADEEGEVLYLEFVDGDVKPQSSKTMDPSKGGPVSSSQGKTFGLPRYSRDSVSSLIDRRNRKFNDSLTAFVDECVRSETVPLQRLRERARLYIPTRSSRLARNGGSAVPDAIPAIRESIPKIVLELRSSPWYTGQIVPGGYRVFESQPAIYGDLDFRLSQDLVNALYNSSGIIQLYAHQTEALNCLVSGNNVVVATSTSSGKSLIYQLPVLHALEEDRSTRAMYVFPTKALAQDQKRSLSELLHYMPQLEDVLVATFDGDTPMTDRRTIREDARIIFTNPDMLHITVLPNEERWRKFLQHLKYVVVDEIHFYNGQLGAHMAFIMRRLRRICAALGNTHVQFVSCSATVTNPLGHFKTIFGIDSVKLIDFDGSPAGTVTPYQVYQSMQPLTLSKGRKEFICWNTPFKDPMDSTSGRGSALLECSRLFTQLMLRGVRIITFCKTRARCEALFDAVRQELGALGRSECAARVMAYRGGYTAQDRRKIESDMFEGKLLGIVATTALELGIDIGTLDCVLTWGFPYTISNLRQQSGRAGRRNKDSLCILLGDPLAVDQHYMQNPDDLFSKPNAEPQIDLTNVLTLEAHLQCAAFELPIKPEEDVAYFGQGLGRLCEDYLIKDNLGLYHCHPRFRPLPSAHVAIRDAEEDQFYIIDITHNRNVVLEELETSRATFTIYDGAIYRHQGNKYLVRDFQPDKHRGLVERVNVDWTTVPRDFTDVDPVETEAIRGLPGSPCSAYYGTIRITQKVFGYFKRDKRGRILDAVQVDNPPIVRSAKGFWLDVPEETLQILKSRGLHPAASIHSAEHAILSLMSTVVTTTAGDVRTECKAAKKELAKKETQRKRPGRLTFYDAKGGSSGSGTCTKAFEHVGHLLELALKRVQQCFCSEGCVECVASETCYEGNEVMGKVGGEVVLKALLNMEIDVDALPIGRDAGIETVIPATPVPGRHNPRERSHSAPSVI